ncbi:MAG: hypothetical protein PHW78_09620, partial [Macromonas bipunctata]|nr:hypothetical protein [Macromonas bipunctata]
MVAGLAHVADDGAQRVLHLAQRRHQHRNVVRAPGLGLGGQVAAGHGGQVAPRFLQPAVHDAVEAVEEVERQRQRQGPHRQRDVAHQLRVLQPRLDAAVYQLHGAALVGVELVHQLAARLPPAVHIGHQGLVALDEGGVGPLEVGPGLLQHREVEQLPQGGVGVACALHPGAG